MRVIIEQNYNNLWNDWILLNCRTGLVSCKSDACDNRVSRGTPVGFLVVGWLSISNPFALSLHNGSFPFDPLYDILSPTFPSCCNQSGSLSSRRSCSGSTGSRDPVPGRLWTSPWRSRCHWQRLSCDQWSCSSWHRTPGRSCTWSCSTTTSLGPSSKGWLDVPSPRMGIDGPCSCNPRDEGACEQTDLGSHSRTIEPWRN